MTEAFTVTANFEKTGDTSATNVITRESNQQIFSVSQNYPDPFNLLTTIAFSLPSRSFVSLKIFDALGRELSVLVSEELSAGTYTRRWNADNYATGVYFYRLSAVPSARRDLVPTGGRDGQAGQYSETKKIILLK